MTPDLLAVVHPWTSAPGQVDRPARTGEEQYGLCVTACHLSINARTLRDTDGVVVVVPPVGFVVVMMTPPVITVNVMRLHLRTMPKSERFTANILCVSVPSSAVCTRTIPVSTLFVNDVEGGLGNPFQLRRHRKGVPYRLSATGRHHPSAAGTVLPRGVWVCGVRLERLEQGAVVGSAQIAEGAGCSTATVIMSRMGHRRPAVDRALKTVYDTVATTWDTQSAAHEQRH